MGKNKHLIIAGVVLLVLVGLTFLLKRDPFEASQKEDFSGILPEIAEGSIDKMVVKNLKGEVVAEKRGEQWWVTEPKEYKCDKTAVEGAAKTLEGLKIVDIASTKKDRQKSYGIDEKGADYVSVKAFSKGTEVLNFIAGKRTADFKGVFVRLASNPDIVYQTDKAMPFIFKNDVKQWRSKIIMDVKKEDIQAVSITNEKGTMELIKDEAGNWTRKDVTDWYGDTNRVGSIIGTFSNLRWSEIEDEPKAATDFGFDKAPASVKITTAAGEKTITFGKEVEASKGSFWLKTDSSEKVYQVRKYVLDKFTKEFDYYKGEKPAPKE